MGLTMKAEYRTECAELEPTYDAFTERRIFGITAMESTDIDSPPGYV